MCTFAYLHITPLLVSSTHSQTQTRHTKRENGKPPQCYCFAQGDKAKYDAYIQIIISVTNAIQTVCAQCAPRHHRMPQKIQNWSCLSTLIILHIIFCSPQAGKLVTESLYRCVCAPQKCEPVRQRLFKFVRCWCVLASSMFGFEMWVFPNWRVCAVDTNSPLTVELVAGVRSNLFSHTENCPICDNTTLFISHFRNEF